MNCPVSMWSRCGLNVVSAMHQQKQKQKQKISTRTNFRCVFKEFYFRTLCRCNAVVFTRVFTSIAFFFCALNQHQNARRILNMLGSPGIALQFAACFFIQPPEYAAHQPCCCFNKHSINETMLQTVLYSTYLLLGPRPSGAVTEVVTEAFKTALTNAVPGAAASGFAEAAHATI